MYLADVLFNNVSDLAVPVDADGSDLDPVLQLLQELVELVYESVVQGLQLLLPTREWFH